MGLAQLKHGILTGLSLGFVGCSQQEIAVPHFSLDQCSRVSLIDEQSGETIRGAEDLVFDAEHGRIFVAAYDRRKTEKAAKKSNSETLPSGGIYAISINQIFAEGIDEITVRPLALPDEFSGGLRPHGMTYDAHNKELIFINRTYEKDGRNWKMTPRLQRIGANGEVFVGITTDAPCAANNVVSTDGDILTSFDHASCGWQAGIENLFNLKRSGFANGSNPIFKGVGFANGIEVTANGDIALAATRENALIILDPNNGNVSELARIELPGGPDNLTITSDGKIIAAIHPKMLRLALNRKLGLGKAPSRIVKADPDTAEVEILFDDPDGTNFSAATVGISLPQGLVLGSVTDAGLLVCREEM
ncbi:NHL repeat-containing protein [Hyphococcus lacteus]|uniref:SMP-30/Gluconolactonase/LRE-like region domain-containing protein n=1 Tax=Hyphococcus lacteus TaxID=3143536 RepID=A0ABV3Z542_9PROT